MPVALCWLPWFPVPTPPQMVAPFFLQVLWGGHWCFRGQKINSIYEIVQTDDYELTNAWIRKPWSFLYLICRKGKSPCTILSSLSTWYIWLEPLILGINSSMFSRYSAHFLNEENKHIVCTIYAMQSLSLSSIDASYRFIARWCSTMDLMSDPLITSVITNKCSSAWYFINKLTKILEYCKKASFCMCLGFQLWDEVFFICIVMILIFLCILESNIEIYWWGTMLVQVVLMMVAIVEHHGTPFTLLPPSFLAWAAAIAHDCCAV